MKKYILISVGSSFATGICFATFLLTYKIFPIVLTIVFFFLTTYFVGKIDKEIIKYK